MSGAYREGLEGLRARLGVEIASIQERASELTPLRQALLGDGDTAARLARELERDAVEAVTLHDTARLLDLLRLAERTRHAIDDAVDAAARALADRPPLGPITVDDSEALYATVTRDELQLAGQRVLSLEAVVGTSRGAKKSFFGHLWAAAPRRLPHFAVRSRHTLSTLASYFGPRVIDHPEFDHHYDVTGDVAVAKILLSRAACDALVRVALPAVRLDARNGLLRLVCGHDGRSARTAITQLPPTAMRALAVVLKEIEEA